jgi:hypothetical protein
VKEIMSEEVTEMIRTLEKANRALERILGVEEDEGECTRCWRDVPESELVTFGDWKLCEICQEDVQ